MGTISKTYDEVKAAQVEWEILYQLLIKTNSLRGLLMIEILLLDDDQDLLEITFEQLMLHFKNIHITKAKSGNEGIDLLMSGHKFDVIISDYNMFHGSGIDLLKFKTSLGYPGYFLFYTSQLTPEVPEILISQEFLGIIEKLKFEELFDKISKALKEKIGFH